MQKKILEKFLIKVEILRQENNSFMAKIGGNMCKLSDDELWEKCKEGGSITPEDLGLKNLNSNDSFY